jgi:hypothetical protein
MTHARSLALCATVLAALAACAGPQDEGESAAIAQPADPACAPDGDLVYLCGLANAEDIVAVGDTGWLVASSINALGAPPAPGRMYLIDAGNKTHRELFPGASAEMRHDREMYPSCPGPLDLQAFDTHGLAVRERAPGVFRLYATSHGALEAIQAFELDVRGEEPAIAWVGCVPLPNGVWANSVVILEDGGFVTTKFMDPTDPQSFAKILAGEINGALYEWRPGAEVTMVPGTELSGANGIELSPDGRFMYVAAFGGREVARFDTSVSPPVKVTVSVDITPDNLRWTPGGDLLTVGGASSAPGSAGGWSVYRIDPQTMNAAVIATVDGSAALQGAATALEVNGEIWIGTYSGDRVGVLPMR